MASRSFKKYANLGLDEEKDFFLAALNKRIRNGRKKLDQIDELSKKDKSTLKAEQLEKINSKAEVLENIKYVDDIKELYYSSYKTAKEEGKVAQSAIEVTPVPATKTEAQPQVQETVQVEQVDTSAIVRDSLSKVLNLVHLVQFFRDQTHAQEFRQALQSVNLESLNELYSKIFTFSESDKFVRIEDKLTTSLSELESYVNATQQPALRNQTYEVLQGAVQRVAESSSFREHKADVSAHQKTGAEHSAIGSELKKVQEQVEAPQQAKTKSPEKVQEVAKVQESPAKEARRDWGAVEDEDEEEEGLENLREEQANVEETAETEKPVEEKKVDDEWSTVTSKHKEKKDEKQTTRGGNKPFRGGEGQRGQRRPRPEGEGENRERRERPEGEAGKTRGTRGGYRGGAGRGGYQKRDGGDEYKRKEGDTYQKKAEGTKPAEAQ